MAEAAAGHEDALSVDACLAGVGVSLVGAGEEVLYALLRELSGSARVSSVQLVLEAEVQMIR